MKLNEEIHLALVADQARAYGLGHIMPTTAFDLFVEDSAPAAQTATEEKPQ